MGDVVPIEAALPHFTGELICLGCHARAVHVWPQHTPLRALVCECGKSGLLIATGQPRLALGDQGDEGGPAA